MKDTLVLSANTRLAKERERLAKDSLYFPGGSPVSMQNFRSPHYHFVLMKEGVSVILYIGECI